MFYQTKAGRIAVLALRGALLVMPCVTTYHLFQRDGASALGWFFAAYMTELVARSIKTIELMRFKRRLK